ncbi:MAG: UDP-N-acetylenolpyruvoylglucosamine reductase [Candidatus Taylorbacteria bacterium]|nr:UDP-N-acetylenolpyruvoylglucosamine reductase [Candidatus Taylorbacteria bacterium]
MKSCLGGILCYNARGCSKRWRRLYSHFNLDIILELTPVAISWRNHIPAMINIQNNISLREYTTFRVGGPARFFACVKSVDELKEAVAWAKGQRGSDGDALQIFVLGGGSNIVVSDAGFGGLVIKNEIPGMEFSDETAGIVMATVGAGENWDSFVAKSVELGLSGIENLSFIPGTVGGGAVQNIGAYGVEVQGAVDSVEVLDVARNEIVDFAAADCGFEYRDSMFKKNPGEFILTRIHFNLKKFDPAYAAVNVSYRDLKEYFSKIPEKSAAPESITPADVREAVIDIRKRKLPDWTKLGTAGSFFKNPVITEAKFVELKAAYPDLPSFPAGKATSEVVQGFVKVPLAWILDNVCGYRGKIHSGAIGVYQNQALVIVNDYLSAGNEADKAAGTAEQIKSLAAEMAQSVREKTGIDIAPEVQYIG